MRNKKPISGTQPVADRANAKTCAGPGTAARRRSANLIASGAVTPETSDSSRAKITPPYAPSSTIRKSRPELLQMHRGSRNANQMALRNLQLIDSHPTTDPNGFDRANNIFGCFLADLR
jgi:hypothetical protein